MVHFPAASLWRGSFLRWRAAGSGGRALFFPILLRVALEQIGVTCDRIFRFFFRRFSPFPFAGLLVVASEAALDHFFAVSIARHDECKKAATAEAKHAERYHNDGLQRQLAHDRPNGHKRSPDGCPPRLPATSLTLLLDQRSTEGAR